jgi:hypothetical protein
MATWQNIGGAWKSGNWWQNVAGIWKQCNLFQNVAGTWRNLSVMFSPDGGNVFNEAQYSVSAQLSCNVPATWTYTLSGFITANLGSGGSSTFITFTTTASGGSPGNRQTRSGSASVTGTANGITRTFQVDLTADGDNL